MPPALLQRLPCLLMQLFVVGIATVRVCESALISFCSMFLFGGLFRLSVCAVFTQDACLTLRCSGFYTRGPESGRQDGAPWPTPGMRTMPTRLAWFPFLQCVPHGLADSET